MRLPKQKPNSWIIPALIVLAIGFFILILSQQSPPEPEIECYEEEVQTMTIQEAANLLDIPLVELTWLPDELDIQPQITTTDNGFRRCWITIDYPPSDSSTQRYLVSITLSSAGGLVSTKTPTRCSWHFTPSGPTGTDCTVELDSKTETLDINYSISPEYPPEIALRILESFQIVEPSG